MSESEGFGLIFEEEEPWIAQRVKPRISRLRSFLETFDAIEDHNTNKYRILAKEFYSNLRETWERLVEELLLNKVVERYCSDVKTQSLKGVSVADEDYRTVYWAMKRVSEFSGHDMAAGRHIPVPKPAEMKADLDKIEFYENEIRRRAKKLEEQRKKLEKPQPARVA